MKRVGWFAVALVGGALAQAASAQDRVYRCGADGRSYSHEPCANGAAIEVADTRSADQVAQAHRVALLDARLADTLERQRQQAESAAARQGPVLIGAPARVSTDPAACHAGSLCAHADRSKHRREKADHVMLYRAPAAR